MGFSERGKSNNQNYTVRMGMSREQSSKIQLVDPDFKTLRW